MRSLILTAVLGLPTIPLRGGEVSGDFAVAPELSERSGVDWLTGEGVSLGGVIFPHLHVVSSFGGSTADPISMLAVGHHDPQSNATLQSLEPGLSLRLGESIEGFGTYSASTDADGMLDGGWEEYFLKLKNLFGDFELRGGQFLNRFGFQNATHNHGWTFVNQNLANGRLLQEGELTTVGGEVTWNTPTSFHDAITVSVGGTPAHEEEEHEESGGEAEFEGEAARFDGYVVGANYLAQLDYNDFHQHRLTASAAWGGNEFGRTTQIYGLGYEYLWRQNGYEAGGRHFRWRNEVILRHVAAVSGEPHGGDAPGDAPPVYESFDEFGLYSMVGYGLNDHVEAGFRVGYVSGVEEMGLDERWRLSPNLTFVPNAHKTVYLRIQYDFDQSPAFGSENSVWAQIGFDWGGSEVR